MFLDFIRDFIGTVPQYPEYTQGFNSAEYYAELLEYSFACILAIISVILVFRLLFYIVNIFRGKGARKL